MSRFAVLVLLVGSCAHRGEVQAPRPEPTPAAALAQCLGRNALRDNAQPVAWGLLGGAQSIPVVADLTGCVDEVTLPLLADPEVQALLTEQLRAVVENAAGQPDGLGCPGEAIAVSIRTLMLDLHADAVAGLGEGRLRFGAVWHRPNLREVCP